MKNIIKTLGKLLLVILSLFLGSCDRFVEVELPDSQLTSVAVFDDMTTSTAAMVGIYAKMRNGGMFSGNSGISYYLGLYADEFGYYQLSPTNNFNKNTLIAAEGGVLDIWSQTYNQIYTANAVLEGTSSSATLPTAGRKQFRGECLFVRALLHFQLLNIFGDIPYVTTTDYSKNSTVKRMPENEVYGLILSDLKEASELLPDAYITSERVRPNRSVALAVLARVYLYKKQYAEALAAASAVINNPLYVWETNLNKVFLKGSTTTIWQFMPNSNTTITKEADLYIFSARPSLIALTPEFVNAFENGDQRKSRWIGSVTIGADTWYYAYKYKQRAATSNTPEYSIVLRLAEQYLIRAEAKLMQGDLNGAKADLNQIRQTAGLSNTSAVTSEEIFTEILKQRRFEFFTEFGQRFFDLKRTGRLDAELSAKKSGWNSNDLLWPIPEKEILINPNLSPQNLGY